MNASTTPPARSDDHALEARVPQPRARDGNGGLHAPHSRWPHAMALVLCCATFPLIWIGGLVTTYDAGMAVPDWPTTFGYNLFLYPWQTWLFGPFDLFIEHGHRLLGAVVGMLAIGLVIAVFLTERARELRAAAVVALGLIVIQGLLGGMRVRLDDRSIALIHACFGLAAFAYLAGLVVVFSPFWRDAGGRREDSSSARRLQRLSLATVGVTYLQVVLGALLRHVPPGASPQYFRVAVIFHLVLAAVLVVHALVLAVIAGRSFGSEPKLWRPAATIATLVSIQLALGAGTWVLKYGWPGWLAQSSYTASFTIQSQSLAQGMVTTAHVAVGASILAQAVVLSLRATRVARTALNGSASYSYQPGYTT